MYHITPLSQDPKTGQVRYCIWNSTFTKMYDIDLSPEKYKAFTAQKKKVQKISWMEALAQSCPDKRTGTYAYTVNSVNELRG